MQPLDAHDLAMNLFLLAVLPVLIWTNRRSAALSSPLHTYLWRENPNFMRANLSVLTMVMCFSALDVLGHYGVISPDLVQRLSITWGVAFLALSLATIVLAAIAAFRLFGRWRTTGLGA